MKQLLINEFTVVSGELLFSPWSLSGWQTFAMVALPSALRDTQEAWGAGFSLTPSHSSDSSALKMRCNLLSPSPRRGKGMLMPTLLGSWDGLVELCEWAREARRHYTPVRWYLSTEEGLLKGACLANSASETQFPPVWVEQGPLPEDPLPLSTAWWSLLYELAAAPEKLLEMLIGAPPLIRNAVSFRYDLTILPRTTKTGFLIHVTCTIFECLRP